MTACKPPATTIAPSKCGNPSSGSPVSLKATAEAAQTAIRPAAGPLIVKYPPLTKVVNTPPITAVIRPEIGGRPIPFAMARDKGSATRATDTAATISFFQCFRNPIHPLCGMSFPCIVLEAVKIAFYTNLLSWFKTKILSFINSWYSMGHPFWCWLI